jgi:hypothetical protein
MAAALNVKIHSLQGSQSNNSLDASGISGLVIDNSSVTQLLPAASTQTLYASLSLTNARASRNLRNDCVKLSWVVNSRR